MAQLTPSDAAIGFPNRSEDQLQPKKLASTLAAIWLMAAVSVVMVIDFSITD